jgi:hypothetical protein
LHFGGYTWGHFEFLPRCTYNNTWPAFSIPLCVANIPVFSNIVDKDRISRHFGNIQFDKIDWDHLHIEMNKKPGGYKMWLFKQHTGHCGTQVKVGYYSGSINGDINCPNCGKKDSAAHLCLCPTQYRLQRSRWTE